MIALGLFAIVAVLALTLALACVCYERDEAVREAAELRAELAALDRIRNGDH